MTRIGLISDTHGTLDEPMVRYLSGCDAIWHAGDIGTLITLQELRKLAPVEAVYGNIDGQDIRIECKAHNRFRCEDVDVWMTHIGGYPGHYAPQVKPEIFSNPPKIFISGHSHILKVIYDKKLDLLHINPGAAGKSGLHKVRTLIRFSIDKADIKDMEVIEIAKRW